MIITEHNVESHDQVRELIDGLQRMAQDGPSAVPLFIATDQEGGRVTRLRLPELTLFPAALHQGKHGDSDYVEAGRLRDRRGVAPPGREHEPGAPARPVRPETTAR